MSEVDPNAVDPNAVDPNAEPAVETLEDILNGVSIEPEPTPVAPVPASPTPAVAATPAATDPNATPAVAPGSVSQADIDAINQRLDAQDQAKITEQVNADISKAVDTVSEVAQNVDKEVIKGLLMVKANEDPRFDAAFENRGKDPTTWDNILRKVGEDIHEKMNAPVDPTVAAGQQAINAMQPGATPTVNEKDQSLLDKNDTEFMAEFNKLAQG